MASGFTLIDMIEGTDCAGCHIQDKPLITYFVETDQGLCADCACVHERQGTIKQVRKKVSLFCEKHSEDEATIFCPSREVAICQRCALTTPHASCPKSDIKDESSDRKSSVLDLVGKGKLRRSEIREHVAMINHRELELDNHLKKLAQTIKNACEEELRKTEEENDQVIKQINRDADVDIDRIILEINKRRHEMVNQAEEEFNQKMRIIVERKEMLITDLKCMRYKYQQESNDVKTHCQRFLSAVEEALQRADKLLCDQKDMLKDYKGVERMLNETVHTKVNVKGVSNVASTFAKVSFKREPGRTLGLVGLPIWEKEDECAHEQGWFPHLIGSVGKNKVVFRDRHDGAIYVTDMRDKTTRKVKSGKEPYAIWSCAALNDGRIVCGTGNAQIVMYDKRWTRTRTTILAKGSRGYSTSISIDKEGMIVAVVLRSNNIYICNPDDGAIVRSIAIRDLDNCPLYGVGCLSSGDIVVCTECPNGKDVCVVDSASGIVKSTTPFRGKSVWGVAVDAATDLIYVIYHREMMCAVDVMFPNGGIKAERIMAYPLDTDLPSLHCFIPEPGKLVLGIDCKIVVFKRIFQNVQEILT